METESPSGARPLAGRRRRWQLSVRGLMSLVLIGGLLGADAFRAKKPRGRVDSGPIQESPYFLIP